jgi:nitroreductase
MTLDEIIQSRRSIRRYSPQPVEREKILACLEAARLAPSAENVQPWRFLVIDEPELKERVAKQPFPAFTPPVDLRPGTGPGSDDGQAGPSGK